MNLGKYTPALLDKISIYNFWLLSINNVAALQDAGIITVTEKQKHYIECGGACLSSIKIGKTDFFDQFIYKIGRDGRPYGRMELSVSDDGYHNLYGLTVEEYRKKIEEAQDYLQETYGIMIDFADAKYQMMEINKTIAINEAYDAYRRPIMLMMNLLPGKLKLLEVDFFAPDKHPARAAEYKRVVKTYAKKSGKNGLQIKIYDKTAQLATEYKIEVGQNLLRCEITLKTPVKIKKVLGSNCVSMVTDDLINTYFNDFVHRNMMKPYVAYCSKRDIAVRRILKRNYMPGSRVWIRNALLEICNLEIKNGVPLILDIEDVIAQIDSLNFGCRQSKYAAKKHFRDLSETKCDVYYAGVSRKYRELLIKLGEGYDHGGI